MKERLCVAGTLVSSTLEEMSRGESLPKFSDMSYDDIEKNMHSVARQVCGIDKAEDDLLEIVSKVRESISSLTTEYSDEDWLKVYELSQELINQTTLAVYQKDTESE